MKRQISALLAAGIILGSTLTCFADPLTTDIKFEGEEIRLSVDDVVERMSTEGIGAETVRLNKLSDEAIASGYKENYDTIQELRNFLNALPYGFSVPGELTSTAYGIEAVIIKKTNDFARENLETNHQADQNKLEYSAYQLYYQTLLVQESLKVTWENYQNKQSMLQLVKKKYELGAASKLEVTTAENMLVSADKELHEARGNWYKVRMNFNLQAGFPLMADTVLTQEIAPVALPDVTLEEAIASALQMRNEIGSIAFGLDVQETLWTHIQLTKSPKSSEYQKQKVAYLQMKQAADSIGPQIEMNLRADYLTLAEKKKAIDAADSTIALASSAYHIQQISYELGACTLQDLSTTQANLNAAKLGKVAAVCEYNLAVQQYLYDMGVGMARIDL